MLSTTERYFTDALNQHTRTDVVSKTYISALTADLDESYNVFRYYAGAADKISGSTIETSPVKFAYVLQEPLGVCGQITP